MIVALLIGFAYRGLEELPGTLIDLYQAWKFCSHQMIADKIIVLTDIESDRSPLSLMRLIVDDVVDANIITFIEDLKKNKQYVQFRPLEFDVQVSTILKGIQVDKMMFYYTGHGICTRNSTLEIKLPDKTTYPVKNIRDQIVQKSVLNSQILWIMDCCHANNLDLPYKWENNKYHLINPDYSPIPEIICLVSSMYTQKSASTNKGSPFTRSLFDGFKNKVRSISALKTHIDEEMKKLLPTYRSPSLLAEIFSIDKDENSQSNKYECSEQNASIYGSYPDLGSLWGWVYGCKNFTVKVDLDNNIVITSSYKSSKTRSSYSVLG